MTQHVAMGPSGQVIGENVARTYQATKAEMSKSTEALATDGRTKIKKG